MSAGHSDVDLSETVWARAFRDTRAFCLSFRGLLAQGLVGGLPAGLGAWLLADPATPTWVTVLVTALSGIVGLLAVVAVAFAGALIAAPVRQRDEARGAVLAQVELAELGRRCSALADELLAFLAQGPSDRELESLYEGADLRLRLAKAYDEGVEAAAEQAEIIFRRRDERARVFEERFAARTYALLTALRSRDDITPGEARKLANPSSDHEIRHLARRLQALGRRLSGDDQTAPPPSTGA